METSAGGRTEAQFTVKRTDCATNEEMNALSCVQISPTDLSVRETAN
jgi:hypothetical protein